MNQVIAEAEAAFAEARAFIRTKAVYYMTTVYGFILYPAHDIPEVQGTLGVTKGMVLYYDPEWIVSVSKKKDGIEEVAGALVHECHHVIRDHLVRGDGFPDQQQANMAGDLAINPDLQKGGWKLPHGIFPKDYGFPEGLSLEEYYDLLDRKKQGGKSKEGQGSPAEEKTEKKGKCGTGNCGGISGSTPKGKFEQALDQQMGRVPAEVKAIAKEAVSGIKNWVKANGRGSIPGSLIDAIAANEVPSQIDWRHELRHLFKKACGRIESGGMDFSMARPSKRSGSRGFPRPGLVQYTPEIGFILDTSASMGGDQIMDALKETVAIFKSTGIEGAWLLQADTRVAHKKKVRIKDLIGQVKIHGRGGTDFDEALRAIERVKPRPDVVVYLTDGDGGVTYKPRGIEVIWCIVSSHWGRAPVDWGHTVIIGPDKKKKVR